MTRKPIHYVPLVLLAAHAGTSCKGTYRDGDSLSQTEQQYIRSLGLLDEGERIYLFDSQGGFSGVEMSGNFFTNKRLAAYWIDKRNPQHTRIQSAYYPAVASLSPTNLSQSLTYSSYLEVQKIDGQTFRVYVDADNVATHTFFTQAIAQWEANRRPHPQH